MITNKGKILPIAENTAMQSRDWPDRDAIVHHKNSIQTKKKNWFIISTEQREYRASAMQWTCETYQSLSYMNMFLFKGLKWRANGRKPKQKTSVQNLVFSFVDTHRRQYNERTFGTPIRYICRPKHKLYSPRLPLLVKTAFKNGYYCVNLFGSPQFRKC